MCVCVKEEWGGGGGGGGVHETKIRKLNCRSPMRKITAQIERQHK